LSATSAHLVIPAEVVSIQLLQAAGVAGAALDAPARGSGAAHVLQLTGWVVAAGGATARCVEVFAHGEFVRTLALDGWRPDVSAIHGGDPRVGFDGGVFLAGRPSPIELELRLGFSDQRPSASFARLEIRRAGGVPTGYSPRFQPVAVTSLGRTGTTLLMRLLTAHPEIGGRRLYPFETRIASYWMHVVRVLGDAANIAQSSHPDTLLSNPYAVGASPFSAPPHATALELRNWLDGAAVERLAAFAQQTIDEHYARLEPNDAEPPNAPRPRYFAEKCLPDHIPRLLREIYPGAKEIFLLRDFRDMVSSIVAFNQRRGGADFGAADAPSLGEFVRAKRLDIGRLLAAIRERPDALVLRYEDLLRQPRSELRRILEHLCLDPAEAVVAAILTTTETDGFDPAEHRTSSSAASSIGRWRRDLTAEIQALCREAFGDLLVEAGYEAD
jgi:hypothetical protein